MRFTSNARRRRAAFLCVLLGAIAFRPPGAVAVDPPSPSLLLAFYAADIPPETARSLKEAISRRLLAELRVAWLPVPVQGGPAGTTPGPPDADGAVLGRIAASLGDAARRMERMETREAEVLLDAAEREARSVRPAEALRPYLAEMFLRRGVLLLWGGNRPGAEEMFGRARVLRPDFEPDPALFSPSFREAWSRAAARPAAGAEILVQSIPPGADIIVAGEKAGVTPARIRIPVLQRIVVRVAFPGYLPVEVSGHWLPGDSEMLDVTLTRDRLARLEELVAAAAGGKEAGAIINEMARAAGAERVAVLAMTGVGPTARIRVLSLEQGDDEAVQAGELEWPEDGEGVGAAAADAAAMLKKAGWPAVSAKAGAGVPWYHKWWLWAVLGVAIAGVAAGGGGSGGGSGGSTGAIGVNF